MDGGAWPFLVGGVICLVNSDNERDSPLLTSRLDLVTEVSLAPTEWSFLGRRCEALLCLPCFDFVRFPPRQAVNSKSAVLERSLLRGIHGSEAVRD